MPVVCCPSSFYPSIFHRFITCFIAFIMFHNGTTQSSLSDGLKTFGEIHSSSGLKHLLPQRKTNKRCHLRFLYPDRRKKKKLGGLQLSFFFHLKYNLPSLTHSPTHPPSLSLWTTTLSFLGDLRLLQSIQPRNGAIRLTQTSQVQRVAAQRNT